MSFPKPFLIELAREKQLADREAEVFWALFGDGKTRIEIAEQLHVQESAISTCLSGVYRKFGISGSGPVKESRLKDELRRREEIWQRQQSTHSSDQLSTPPQSDEFWIEKIREHCRQKILSQHSRMRLLSGEEIGVDQLYVDVWLLNRSPRTFQISESKLLETFDLRNDRLGMGDRIKRNPGFEVANNNPKLVILGKPGSGKTTFLKHLAVDWCKGKFQPDSIVVLIELRRIRDAQWNLIKAIGKELGLENQQLVIKLLQQGKFLALMDGLDEVPTGELRRSVYNQFAQIVTDYPGNRIVITCRTQIMHTIPNGFTSVELAEFNEAQIQQFFKNWFITNGNSNQEVEKQWREFSYVLDKSLSLREITTTPILLGLMCLVLQDSGEISIEQDWLCQKGIKLLLSKWNDAKQNDGWEIGTEIFRKLSLEQKEALLTEIAARKFENPDNFVLFQQDEIVSQITQSLQLTSFSEGINVLKAIEAQHGLLIERADELWSFSHLTFQEYFTKQWLTKLPPEELVEKIENKRWQEAVKQIFWSQQPADRLAYLIKQAIDQSIACDSKLQAFLMWILQKSASIQTNYKPADIRMLYFTCALDSTLYLALYLAPNLNFNHTLRLNCRAHNLILERTLDPKRTFDLILDQDFVLDLALDSILTSNHSHEYASHLAFDHTLSLIFALYHAHTLALYRSLGPELGNELSKLMSVLSNKSIENFQKWWQANGSQWIEQLRIATIEHRNIGYDWKFTKMQIQELQRYYDLNKFLVELIKIEGAVTDMARAGIEDTLWLPWVEIQRLQR